MYWFLRKENYKKKLKNKENVMLFDCFSFTTEPLVCVHPGLEHQHIRTRLGTGITRG